MSARSDRRAQTLLSIHRTAIRLAADRGLDGFTMEELAEEVGVSRRTLFNYYPGKLDAVLGPDDPPDAELFEVFVAGGPTGHLTQDLKALVLAILEHKGVDEADFQALRHLTRTEPRFLRAIHDRFEAIVEECVPFFRQREGDRIGDEQARMLIRLLLALFDVALDGFHTDPDRPIAEHFSRAYDALTDLFR